MNIQNNMELLDDNLVDVFNYLEVADLYNCLYVNHLWAKYSEVVLNKIHGLQTKFVSEICFKLFQNLEKIEDAWLYYLPYNFEIYAGNIDNEKIMCDKCKHDIFIPYFICYTGTTKYYESRIYYPVYHPFCYKCCLFLIKK